MDRRGKRPGNRLFQLALNDAIQSHLCHFSSIKSELEKEKRNRRNKCTTLSNLVSDDMCALYKNHLKESKQKDDGNYQQNEVMCNMTHDLKNQNKVLKYPRCGKHNEVNDRREKEDSVDYATFNDYNDYPSAESRKHVLQFSTTECEKLGLISASVNSKCTVSEVGQNFTTSQFEESKISPAEAPDDFISEDSDYTLPLLSPGIELSKMNAAEHFERSKTMKPPLLGSSSLNLSECGTNFLDNSEVEILPTSKTNGIGMMSTPSKTIESIYSTKLDAILPPSEHFDCFRENSVIDDSITGQRSLNWANNPVTQTNGTCFNTNKFSDYQNSKKTDGNTFCPEMNNYLNPPGEAKIGARVLGPLKTNFQTCHSDIRQHFLEFGSALFEANLKGSNSNPSIAEGNLYLEENEDKFYNPGNFPVQSSTKYNYRNHSSDNKPEFLDPSPSYSQPNSSTANHSSFDPDVLIDQLCNLNLRLVDEMNTLKSTNISCHPCSKVTLNGSVKRLDSDSDFYLNMNSVQQPVNTCQKNLQKVYSNLVKSKLLDHFSSGFLSESSGYSSECDLPSAFSEPKQNVMKSMPKSMSWALDTSYSYAGEMSHLSEPFSEYENARIHDLIEKFSGK